MSMHMDHISSSTAETAVALALALGSDARFPDLARRLTNPYGPFAVVHWLRGIAADVDAGIITASNDDTVEIDFFKTIDRVAIHLLDRGLWPGGTIPSGEPLTHFTIWAAHQR
jgi:hypothetical protein